MKFINNMVLASMLLGSASMIFADVVILNKRAAGKEMSVGFKGKKIEHPVKAQDIQYLKDVPASETIEIWTPRKLGSMFKDKVELAKLGYTDKHVLVILITEGYQGAMLPFNLYTQLIRLP